MTAATTAAAAASQPTASVSLHPLASRGGHQSSTIVSVQIPQREANDDLPCLQELQASLDEESPAGPLDLRHPSTPRPSSSSREAEQPWGIVHDDLDQYPVVDDRPVMCTFLDEDNYPHIFPVDDAPPIRAMTVQQLVSSRLVVRAAATSAKTSSSHSTPHIRRSSCILDTLRSTSRNLSSSPFSTALMATTSLRTSSSRRP